VENAGQQSLRIIWDAFGERWYASVTRDSYLGNEIAVIDVAIGSAAEQLNRYVSADCYYRGTLTDAESNPLPDTHAYFNLCDSTIPFVGFVSNRFNVFTIARTPGSPTRLDMLIDNQNQAVVYEGISPFQGEPNLNIQKGLFPRTAATELFPRIEIAVEPAYVQKFGEDAYLDRIIESLAFANFIYAQSGMKQLTLAAILLLDQNVIWSGGSGSVRSNIHNLRWRLAQETSADMLMVYLGSNVNTNNLWGWGELGYACDLQRALVQGWSLNSNNIGRASGYLTPLPSLIQRGWLLAHETTHILNSNHIKQDPLMDSYFQYFPALSDYKAGCNALVEIYKTCAFNPKNGKFTDFYSCD